MSTAESTVISFVLSIYTDVNLYNQFTFDVQNYKFNHYILSKVRTIILVPYLDYNL